LIDPHVVRNSNTGVECSTITAFLFFRDGAASVHEPLFGFSLERLRVVPRISRAGIVKISGLVLKRFPD
jgi:hypothetical protein